MHRLPDNVIIREWETHAQASQAHCWCAQGTTISLSSRIASLAIDHASQDDHASLDDHKGGSTCGSTHSTHQVKQAPDLSR